MNTPAQTSALGRLRTRRFFAGLLAVCIWSLASLAHAAPQVSLLTFAPGEVYWQRFGHNALLVREAGAQARVYNYGVFDFGQKNFFLNFARGRMRYRLDVAPLDWTLAQYAAEGRAVVEQVLALSDTESRALADYLAWNARPENAEYHYDYFISNCSTKTRDAIDRVLGGQLQKQLSPVPGSGSYRSEVLRLIQGIRPLLWGMDLILGARADGALNAWQDAFLPERLMSAVRGVQVGDAQQQQPLVRSERVLSGGAVAPAENARLRVWAFLLCGLGFTGLLSTLQALRHRRPVRVLLGALSSAYVVAAGVLGSVLMLGAYATDHWGMSENSNQLLLHPLWFLLLVPALRGLRATPKAAGWLARFAALLIVLATILAVPVGLFGDQSNGHWLALLVIPNLWLALHLGMPQRARASTRSRSTAAQSR